MLLRRDRRNADEREQSYFSVSDGNVIAVLAGTFAGSNASGSYGGTFSGT